jgi:hypothetical protein
MVGKSFAEILYLLIGTQRFKGLKTDLHPIHTYVLRFGEEFIGIVLRLNVPVGLAVRVQSVTSVCVTKLHRIDLLKAPILTLNSGIVLA